MSRYAIPESCDDPFLEILWLKDFPFYDTVNALLNDVLRQCLEVDLERIPDVHAFEVDVRFPSVSAKVSL